MQISELPASGAFTSTDVLAIDVEENGVRKTYKLTGATLAAALEGMSVGRAAKTDLTSIIATGTTNTTGAAIAAGTYFYLNGVLVQAKANIASGATFTSGTNYEVVTAGGLNALNSQLADISTRYEELCNNSNYYTVGTKITLSKNINNFRYIVFLSGYASTGETSVTYFMPVVSTNYRNDGFTIDCSSPKYPGRYMTLKWNSNTELEIIAVTSNFDVYTAVRTVFGMY